MPPAVVHERPYLRVHTSAATHNAPAVVCCAAHPHFCAELLTASRQPSSHGWTCAREANIAAPVRLRWLQPLPLPLLRFCRRAQRKLRGVREESQNGGHAAPPPLHASLACANKHENISLPPTMLHVPPPPPLPPRPTQTCSRNTTQRCGDGPEVVKLQMIPLAETEETQARVKDAVDLLTRRTTHESGTGSVATTKTVRDNDVKTTTSDGVQRICTPTCS